MNVTQIIQEMTWRLGNRSDIVDRTLVWLNDAYFELLMSPRFTYYQLDRTTSVDGSEHRTCLSDLNDVSWDLVHHGHT